MVIFFLLIPSFLKTLLYCRGTEIIAIAFDVCNMWMHCVFADHSFVVHDIVDMTSPKVHALHQFHGSCIWDVKVRMREIIHCYKNCFVFHLLRQPVVSLDSVDYC